MPRVFVTQRKLMYDAYRGDGRNPKINPAKFARFGAPVYVTGEADLFECPQATNFPAIIAEALEHNQYNPAEDHLLICGDTGIGAMTYHAMLQRGGVNMLLWDRFKHKYTVLAIRAPEMMHAGN